MKIKFLPQNIEVEANSEKSLMQIALENNLEIRSICKGVPSCAECRVRIVEGETNILPPNKAELSLIGTNYFIDGRRLSCQVHCFGDVTVDLTEQIVKSETQTKKIRGFRTSKQAESRAVNDTLLLDDKAVPVDISEPAKGEDAPQNPPRENRGGQGRGQQQQQSQNKKNDQSREAKGSGGGNRGNRDHRNRNDRGGGNGNQQGNRPQQKPPQHQQQNQNKKK